MTKSKPPVLRKDGLPKRSGRPPKDPTQDVKPRKPAPVEDDDLLGSSVAPTNPNAISYEGAGEVDGNVHAGVSPTWLGEHFHMAIETVRKRLANCPIKGKRRNAPLYDIFIAAQYLVPPKVDISAYIKAMRPNDLPPMLQDAYWGAMKKKQDWEIKAGNLWPTDSVIEVFGETFKLIKNAVSLWADTLEQEQSLTETQREALRGMADGLLAEIHNSLVSQSRNKSTPNQHAELALMEKEAAATSAPDDE